MECSGGTKKLMMSGSEAGTMTFTFGNNTDTKPTFVTSITTTGACVSLKVYYEGGGSDTIDTTGGSATPVNKENVFKMEVGCTGAGAVEEIKYMFCPPEVTCPLFELDFGTLQRGHFVTDELQSSYHVVISAEKDRGPAWTPRKNPGCTSTGTSPNQACYTTHVNEGGAPRVFDTSTPQCRNPSNNRWSWGDPDLGAPHKEFGGDGVGCGGGQYYMRKKRGSSENGLYNTQKRWSPPARNNCVFIDDFHTGNLVRNEADRVINPWVNQYSQGNVLIISENNPGPTALDKVTFDTGNRCPDDTGGVRTDCHNCAPAFYETCPPNNIFTFVGSYCVICREDLSFLILTFPFTCKVLISLIQMKEIPQKLGSRMPMAPTTLTWLASLPSRLPRLVTMDLPMLLWSKKV